MHAMNATASATASVEAATATLAPAGHPVAAGCLQVAPASASRPQSAAAASADLLGAAELALLAQTDPTCVVARWRSELGEEHAFTAEELERWASKVACLLAGRGVGVGDVVALALGRSYQRLFVELALAKLGATALVLPEGAEETRVARLLQRTQACAVVCTNQGAAAEVLDHVVYLCPSVTTRLLVNADGAPAFFADPAEHDDACVLPAYPEDGLPHGAALSGPDGVCALCCVRAGWLDFNTCARVAPTSLAAAQDALTGATLRCAGRAA